MWQGKVYRPNVVRVGSEEAPLASRVRDVWVDGLVRRYVGLTRAQWAHESKRQQQEVIRLSKLILEVQKRIAAGDGSGVHISQSVYNLIPKLHDH
jgi:hypothetical protein